MKALTLTQPWATLVAIGAKRIETRSWTTRYSGRVAIHAGKGLSGMSEESYRALVRSQPHFGPALRAGGYPLAGIKHLDNLPRGKVVAVGHLVGCASTEQICEDNGIWRIIGGRRRHWALTEQEASFGDYSPGRYAWLLADVRALAEPIAARGMQGLWEWTPPEGVEVPV